MVAIEPLGSAQITGDILENVRKHHLRQNPRIRIISRTMIAAEQRDTAEFRSRAMAEGMRAQTPAHRPHRRVMGDFSKREDRLQPRHVVDRRGEE